jgi:hypothetical protein
MKLTRSARKRLLVVSACGLAILSWFLSFGSSMVKLHGRGYCVWGVNIPFSHGFAVLPPLGVAALAAGMFVSAGTFFFTVVATRSE